MLAGGTPTLWIMASEILDSELSAGDLHNRAALAATLLWRGGRGYGLHPSRAVHLFGPRGTPFTRAMPLETRRFFFDKESISKNQFRKVASRRGELVQERERH